MDELTRAITRARSANSEARQRWAALKADLEFMEASLFLGCDYKSLGSNEETRKVSFKVNVLGKDEKHATLTRMLADAETERESTGVVLENLLDQRRAYENALRAEFIKGRYGVSVVVKLDDDEYGEFELSVMAETYFESI